MKPWECPRCGTIHAPWTSSCTCRRPVEPPGPPRCERPPIGWYCIAPAGHDGPCPTVRDHKVPMVPRAKPRAVVLEDVEGDPPDAWDQAPTKVATDSAVKRLENVQQRPAATALLAPRALWDGLCNAKKHGLDWPNQVCDLCAKERKIK